MNGHKCVKCGRDWTHPGCSALIGSSKEFLPCPQCVVVVSDRAILIRDGWSYREDPFEREVREIREQNSIDISDLSPQHQIALKMFVDKFKAGAKQHGDINQDKSWTKDILDEEIDAGFYRIFELLRILNNGK